MKEIYGDRGDSWLQQLESQVMNLCVKQNLRFLSAIPNLTYNFVGLVEFIENKQTAILKIALEKTNIENEVNCLRCFTFGVPKVYWYDEKEHAMLIEHLQPGYPLKKLVIEGNDDLATRILCTEILNLQRNQQQKTHFKPISLLAETLTILDGCIDRFLLSKAKKLFEELTKSTKQDVVLHGDLHHDNVLASQDGWKAIDPHGYIGDPVFEVGSIIFNPYDCFPTYTSLSEIIHRRFAIMIEALPFDSQRIKAWLFCKTILSLSWTLEDHGKINEKELEIARIIDEIRV